ncbi:MAG: hypothetical protein FJZ96_08915 [Chloroflexi bacterium]|nr:hypothetical protein [Chloroflexota bacterium]
MMPEWLYEVIDLIASLIRLVGMAVFGLGIGWLALDLLRKAQAWQLQIAVYLGFVGLAIAMAYYLPWGALGMFTIGAGLAILMWGMPKKKKEEKDSD